ncbi:MAG: alkaline phosphatase family protein [Actinomycetota bacterium]
MLTVLQFDAASASTLERLAADGRLPNLTALRARGVEHRLDAPATQFAAGAQYTLYSGVPIEEHGLFYPFQWDPADQRVHYMEHFDAPPTIWEQLGHQGVRTLAVDPYESRPPTVTPPGTLVCGWQLNDRVVLRSWDRPTGSLRRLQKVFGAPEPVDEVFGLHRAGEMLRLRRRLLAAPGRVADATTLLLGDEEVDLAWSTFCAAHVAGHQFWDLSQIDPTGLDDDAARVLGTALDDVYAEVDRAIGRIVGALPAGSDLMVICPVGMEINTSRADMLPEMLDVILSPERERSESSSIWWLRAAVPPGFRAAVAGALPAEVALNLTARLEMRGVDWSTTRAFAHPAENQGYIRLNLRGRERDGIVDPGDAPALMDEITEGLMTFRDLDGGEAVAGVARVGEHFGHGSRADLLPDLVVRWTDTPATNLEGVHSERYGTVKRRGVGSGRSGNHTEGDAWALVVPGSSRHADLRRPPQLEDVAATVAAVTGGDRSEMVGEPLLVP